MQHLLIAGIYRRCRALWRGIDIGFIQKQHGTVRYIVDHALDRLCVPPGTHRVIGIGDIDQLGRNLDGLLQQCSRVFVVIGEGYHHEVSAKAVHMKIEGWIGPERCHHIDAGLHINAGNTAQQRVNSSPKNNVLNADAMVRSQCLTQFQPFGIGIFPYLTSLPFHYFYGFW